MPPASIPATVSDLWIFSGRPDRLVDCFAAAHALRGRFRRVHFVYQDSAPWRRANWDEYRDCFDTVTAIPKVDPCRAVIGVVKYTLKIQRLKLQLQDLRIEPKDLILCMTALTPMGQTLVSLYRRNHILFCVPQKMATDLQKPADFSQYRHTTAGWLGLKFVEPFLGLKRSYTLKTRRPEAADGERLRRFVEDIRQVYSSALVFHNAYAPLPSDSEDFFFHTPYPSARFLGKYTGAEHDSQAQRLVVFFGTPFLLLKNIEPRDYIESLNGCLDYLRRYYAHCQLVYRPHPFETEEQRHLRLEGFEVQMDKEAGELFLLRHAQRLEAVYTVSSSVARTAMNYGLNGYAFWPVFPFKGKTRDFFRAVMGTVPHGFLIESLDRPPVAYALPERVHDSFERFQKALESAIRAYWRGL